MALRSQQAKDEKDEKPTREVYDTAGTGRLRRESRTEWLTGRLRQTTSATRTTSRLTQPALVGYDDFAHGWCDNTTSFRLIPVTHYQPALAGYDDDEIDITG
jgi:hypothetical protein